MKHNGETKPKSTQIFSVHGAKHNNVLSPKQVLCGMAVLYTHILQDYLETLCILDGNEHSPQGTFTEETRVAFKK